jgi:hypothetical protein
MKRRVARGWWLVGALLVGREGAAQQRLASDFEIAQMEKQLATARDFSSRLSGHLNLGDLRMARNEPSLARGEYGKALDVATEERLAARKASEMARYATATAYAGLASAYLGDDGQAFGLLEESIRYASDSAKTWNLYATAMNVMEKPDKAVSASRNAVALAEGDVLRDPSRGNRLDLAIDQYALASALGDTPESEQLLTEVIRSLRSPTFKKVQEEVARAEQFEIYSVSSGESFAYLSLLNRAQLRLAGFYEARGDVARARQQYENVLAGRTDDPLALAALARLGRSSGERERYFAEAFDANPFAMKLIDEYRKERHGEVEGSSTGAEMRRLLNTLAGRNFRTARTQLETLEKKFPANATLHTLREELETAETAVPSFFEAPSGDKPRPEPSAADLRAVMALLSGDHITAEQRKALDAMTFTSSVIFPAAAPGAPAGQTIFDSGLIGDVPFRFGEPTAFRGAFKANTPLHLTYRILGATTKGGNDALLLEPLGLAP